ncbi:ribonuclease H-like domain-containing protein [Tanacetum coccineum]
MLCTINNLIRTLLFQAHIPPSYWVEALNMAAHLLNILPSTAINNEIPFTKLYNQTPTYEHLRVFGCLCYPHVDVSHKLEPRSTPCIFLGYPANHRGYRCLDLASNKIIISRHVRFDEDVFPFGNLTSSNKPTYDFLLPPIQTTSNVPTTEPFVQHMDEPNNLITPHPTTPPTSPPQPNTPPSHSSTPIPPQPDTHPSHSSTPIPTSTQTQSHAQTVDSHTPIPINNSSQTMPTHPMVTRAKAGIFKPLERMNCHVTTTSPLPRSHVHALRDPNWKEAMLDEYNALITNGTWDLVPRPANVNVVRSMWLFKHKFNADGSLSRYKARLVANGRSQQQGIDCDETFSPVVKPATIRTVLSLAVSRNWPIHQLDVKNAFLHGHLSETVYMHQPPEFVDPNKPDYVCHLQRSLYGLKQAQRSDIAYLLLYVDDIILTASSSAFLQRVIASLHNEFAMKDLGSLNYFLGISAQRSASGLFLSQSKFAEEILERAHIILHLYAHTYLMQVCLYMLDPRDPHFTALKRILGYVRGTLDYGLQLHVSSTTQLSAYTNADWTGCLLPVTLSRSSVEAEYRGVANVVAETAWIHNLLCELHTPLFTATLVYYDNVSVVYMSANPVQHQHTKHIEIDIHFVRDFVASGQVRVLHKGTLVILDDVWKHIDLKSIGIPFENEYNNCKVILTSRGKDACEAMKCHDIPTLDILTESETWSSLREVVGDLQQNDPELSETASEIAKMCGGLPIAAVCLGRALKDKRKEVWNDTLKKLQSSMVPANIEGVKEDVYQSVQLSYDLLQDLEAKKVFLLCCLYPDYANVPLEALSTRSHEKLKSRYLLLSGDRKSTVKPRGMTYGNYNAVSVVSNEISELPSRGLNFHKLELLQLACPKLSLEKIKNIYILDLCMNCKLENIGDIKAGEFENLEILSFEKCDIIELPTQIGKFTNLRLLDMSGCHWLERISPGVISSLMLLLKLDIIDTHIGGGIDKLLRKNTEKVFLTGDGMKNALKELVLGRFQLVKTLTIENYNNEGVEYLSDRSYSSDASGVFSSLEKLRMEKMWHLKGILRHGDRWLPVGSFSRLRNIHLSVLPEMAHLFTLSVAMNLVHLESLHIEYCTIMQQVIDNPSPSEPITTENKLTFPKLTKLVLNDIISLVCFTQGINLQVEFPLLKVMLPILETLEVSELDSVEELWSSQLPTNHFGQLTSLRVKKCHKLFNMFPSDLQTLFPSLEKLEVEKCDSLEEVWASKAAPIRSLKSVHVYECPKLRNLCSFYTFKGLSNLMTIGISSCKMMEAVVADDQKDVKLNGVLSLNKLEEVTLEFLPNLNYFSNTKCDLELPELTQVIVKNCPDMRTFTESSVRTLKLKFAVLDDGHVENGLIEYYFCPLFTIYEKLLDIDHLAPDSCLYRDIKKEADLWLERHGEGSQENALYGVHPLYSKPPPTENQREEATSQAPNKLSSLS